MFFPIPQNTGVIPRDPQPGDYIAEGDTGIEYEVNETTGSHEKYVFPDTDGDYQVGVYFDTSACTDYGCCHSEELQASRHLAMGHLTKNQIDKLILHKFIVNGKLTRLSKRYNAIKAGTNGPTAQ